MALLVGWCYDISFGTPLWKRSFTPAVRPKHPQRTFEKTRIPVPGRLHSTLWDSEIATTTMVDSIGVNQPSTSCGNTQQYRYRILLGPCRRTTCINHRNSDTRLYHSPITQAPVAVIANIVSSSFLSESPKRINNKSTNIFHGLGSCQRQYCATIRRMPYKGNALLGKKVCVFLWPFSRGGGVLDRINVLDLMHARSRMTMGPRIPAMPGRTTPDFPDQINILLAPSAKSGRVFGESQ